MTAIRVQHVGNSHVAVAAPTLAYTSNVAAGNLLVAVVVASAPYTVTVTDSQGNTWQQCGTKVRADGTQQVNMHSAIAGSSAANTVTFTFVAAPTYTELMVIEYNWAGVSATPDAVGDAIGNLEDPSVAVVTTEANSLCVGTVQVNDPSQTVTGAFSMVSPPSVSMNTWITASIGELLDSGSVGSKTLNVNSGGDTPWAAVLVAFKTGSAPPATVDYPPTSDVSIGSWTTSTGSGTLTSHVSEATPNPANYIQSPLDPVNSYCELEFTLPTPITAEPAVVSYMPRQDGGATMRVELRASDGFLVATWDEATPPATFGTIIDYELDSTQAANWATHGHNPSRLRFYGNPT